MNLADAIRIAAQTSGVPVGQVESTEDKSARVFEFHAREADPGVDPALAKEQKMKQPQEAHETPPGHNVVRLELVLSPEQLKGFFGAVIAGQHSVLTLREAAHFLRVSQRSLEIMALAGDVPGMMVDGKWRFTRQALEDWVSAHPTRKEA
ncbi:MAG: helix-turn-helix domain-containing protein [Fimbriimonadales bacterium]